MLATAMIDKLITPPVFFFKYYERYVPFPILYYQLIEKPFHIRALCKCKCCDTILCHYYVYFGGERGLYATKWGYESPNMWMNLELFSIPLPESIYGHKLYQRVYKIYEVHDMSDGRFFALVNEIGEYTSKKYYKIGSYK